MGYALIQPHTLGIRDGNEKDLDAFVFFWAVINSMLGIKDEFNLCLHPLSVVKIICENIRRYIFVQVLQMETPMFDQMARTFHEGQSIYIPLMSYEVMIFLNKRTAGVPGYQYKIDLGREQICKQIFTSKELEAIHEKYSAEQGYIIDDKIRIMHSGTKNQPPVTIVASDSDWLDHLNDFKFKNLKYVDQLVVKMFIYAFEASKTWWGDVLINWFLDRTLRQMQTSNK